MQDQVSAQLADHGDFRAHYEAQLGQVLSHLIAAIDLFDDVYITYVCHTQRHHRQHSLQLDISNARGFKMVIEELISSNHAIV